MDWILGKQKNRSGRPAQAQAAPPTPKANQANQTNQLGASVINTTSHTDYRLSSTPTWFIEHAHTGDIISVIELDDGTILTVSRDKTIKKWSRTSKQPLLTFRVAHLDAINAAIMVDDQTLLTGALDHTIKQWNVSTGRYIQSISVSDRVRSLLKLKKNSGLFVCSLNGGIVEVRKTSNIEEVVCSFKASEVTPVTTMCELQDGSIITGCRDFMKRWKDGEWQKCLQTYTMFANELFLQKVIEMDSKTIASAGSRDVRVWDVETAQCLHHLTEHTHMVFALIKLSDGLLMSGGGDQTIRVWDVKTGKCLMTHQASALVAAIAELRDGSIAYATSDEGSRIYVHTSWIRESESSSAPPLNKQLTVMTAENAMLDKREGKGEEDQRTKESQPQEMQARVEQKEKELKQLEADLKANMKEFEQRRRSFEEEMKQRETKLQADMNAVKEQWKQIEHRTKELDERDKWLSQKEASLKERETLVSQQQSGSKGTSTTFGSIVGCYRLSLIERVTSQFDDAKQIGRGGFGRVFKATIGTIDVAIKRMEKKKEEGKEREQEFLQEISIASSCKHPCIVPLIGFCFERKERCLIYPLMKGGSLEDRLSPTQSARLNSEKRVKVSLQIAEAIDFLHNSEGGERAVIFHRDIKPSNILLDERDNAKLTDVGTAKYASTGSLSGDTTMRAGVVGSYGYIDPEYAASMQYTTASDVFSFGVVMLRLWTGYPSVQDNQLLTSRMRILFRNRSMTTAINYTDPTSGRWPAQAATDYGTLAMSCVSTDPYDRPSMEEVVKRLTSILQDHFQQTSVVADQDERCVVCMTQAKGECRMEPCKHSATCVDCALEITSKSGNNRCPICKVKITDLNEI
eukprot:TRINITY_DN268_c0_g2_i1.p1 TRINITY_DN268_c0_g2~~TRINITY_DN268_c0_g2_i1.p1  ORF type:complete len:858 (+),score=228.73 TRINITY_DN268_c0_g2_i1:166-2739(+)